MVSKSLGGGMHLCVPKDLERAPGWGWHSKWLSTQNCNYSRSGWKWEKRISGVPCWAWGCRWHREYPDSTLALPALSAPPRAGSEPPWPSLSNAQDPGTSLLLFLGIKPSLSSRSVTQFVFPSQPVMRHSAQFDGLSGLGCVCMS